jgi:DNA invertase Pin-like site-specific DNA recombinase
VKLCANRGWTPVEYIDNDTSASSGKRRPAYERMLADIRDGAIGAVVAWDLDRLHRRPIELEAFMAMADERHLALATVSGDVDLSTAQGRLTARLKGSVAAHEIEHKRARQLRAAQQKAERGEPQWRNAFGYMPDGSRVPDPQTAPLVKRVYAHVLAGGSITDGARMLNDEGAYGRWNKPWTPSTLSLFLRAPRNAGLRSHNGEIIGQGNWPGLVDESTWRTVQSILSAPGRAPGKKTVRKHLLTGVLKCGKPGCDGYLSGQWVMHPTGGAPGRPKAGETKQPSGQVAHSITYGCKKCRGVSIRAEYVEPLVYKVVSGRLAEPDAVDLLRSKQFDPDEAKRLDDEKQTLYGQIRAAEAEYDEGIIDGRRLAARKERVAEKLGAIEARQQDAERLRVFDGLPLGTPEVADAVKRLSGDRLRAVIGVLVEFTVAPVGKGRRVNGERFDPERVSVDWL